MKLPLALLLACAASCAAPLTQDAAAARFSSGTIDLGVVVSDLDASARFYVEALGFQEVDAFDVDADFCTRSGLTDNHPLSIRVFATGVGEDATQVKLMELPGVASKPGDHRFIHSQLGYSYLTVWVTSTDAALARLEAAGAAERALAPVLIGDDPSGLYLTLVRDPDGNLIELIGPRG